MTVPATPRTDLSTRVAAVQARIDAACGRVGRDPSEVTLIGVSKTHDIQTVAEAVAAGLNHLGENRAQEFVGKARGAEERGLRPHWHFIGHLQRNKVRDVLPHVAVLHSLDSARLVEEIERRAELRPNASTLACYIEVNVGGEAQKQGVAPEALDNLLRAASNSAAVEIIGLMTVAPRVSMPEEARPVFRTLRELAEAHGLRGLSMGMTEDFEIAIEEGATAIRVGRAIFGERTG